MIPELYLISAILITGFAILAWFLNQKLKHLQETQKQDTTLTQWLKSMQASIENTSKVINQSLHSSNKNLSDTLHKSSQSLNQRLDKAAEVIGALQKEAGQFSSVSQSMQELNTFLKSPKLRGNIGEQVLKDLISQIFPKKAFHLQYSFKGGTKVDAAIQTDAGILPIDSKLPMENFQALISAKNKTSKTKAHRAFARDVKRHVDDIAKKYILPEEGTMDFALMYLPSEPVYYEVVNDTTLTDYARRKRVYPVSPTTMYAHLQMILLTFEGKKIESRSREVFALMRAIQKDYEKIETHLSTLGSHVSNAFNKFSEVDRSFTLMGQKISTSSQLKEPDTKPKQIK